MSTNDNPQTSDSQVPTQPPFLWDLKKHSDPKYKKLFCQDFRDSQRDFHSLWVGGGRYTAPPFPHNLCRDGKRDDAITLLEEIKEPWLIEMMAGSDVGNGTDPERKDNKLLNTKADILDVALFPTMRVEYNLHRANETVYTLRKRKHVSKKNKIDFGITSSFPEVPLGFDLIHRVAEHKDVKHEIIGIKDKGYIWATVESHLKREALRKHLHKDFKEAVDNLKRALQKWSDNKEARISEQLMKFMDKYGTHVILKCSYGYRRQEIEEREIETNDDLHEFRTGLRANIMDVVKVNFGGERSSSTKNSKTSFSGDMKSCGPPCSVDEAFRGSLLNDDWSRRVSISGDSGVIYHDVTMPIADMLEGHPKLKHFTEVYRFWASERVRDLQQGWNQSLFSCSYMIGFFSPSWYENKENKIAKACVHVDCMGKKCTNSYALHQYPKDYPEQDQNGNKSISFVTPVLSRNVETITIRSFDEKTNLNSIVRSIQIFFRQVRDGDHKGIVKRFYLEKSTLDNIDSPLVKLTFSDCKLKEISKRVKVKETSKRVKGTLDALKMIYPSDDTKEKKYDDDTITIAMARSIARGWTSEGEDSD